MELATKERINGHVTAARGFSAEIKALLDAGKAINDPEVRELMDKRDAALDAGDAERQNGEAEERIEIFNKWENELSSGAPRPTVQEIIRPNDPTATPEYAAAFRSYVHQFNIEANPAPFTRAEKQVLTIQSDPAGGYTVPADDRAEILRRLPALSRVLAKCNLFPTSRDNVEWTRVRPRSSSGSIYTSAFVGDMVGETPGGTEGQNEPEFGKIIIPVKKGRSKALISQDLAADSATDIMAFLRGDGAINMALLRESQVIAGSGVGKNVKGIVEYAGTTTPEDQIATVDISGTTADQISNTAADAGSAPKIIDWVFAVPAQYRQLPSFAICLNSDSQKRVRKLIDANNNFLWAPGFAGMPNELLGYDVVISEFLASGGTDGNKVGVAGAWDQLAVPVRMDVSAQVLVERYADEDEIGLFLRQRFGAAPQNVDAFRIAIV